MNMDKISQTLKCWVIRTTVCLLVLSATLTANATEELYFYHTDHLGTPQAMTDSQGQVVWQGHYRPFGEVEIAVEGVESNLRFPGQYYDQESGNFYNYFRDYDPTTGRYLQSDPIGLEGGINTYAYVANNPLTYTDPMGLIPPGWWDQNKPKTTPGQEKTDCVAKCMIKREAICGPYRIAGSTTGLTFAAAGSVWSGELAFPILGRAGAFLGSQAGRLACEKMMFDESCFEECKKDEPCDAENQ